MLILRSTMDLPQATIYSNPAKAPTHECARCIELAASKVAVVRSDFGPVLCHRHRDNSNAPTVGFAYINATELAIINHLRKFNWTEEALAELAEKVHREEMARMSSRFVEVSVADPAPEPKSPIESLYVQAMRRLSSNEIVPATHTKILRVPRDQATDEASSEDIDYEYDSEESF